MSDNTIKQAAKIAGVSVASVSRALNGKPGISEKTRKRIIDICNQLGYQPSDAARRLKIGREAHIALFMGADDSQHSHYITSLFESLAARLKVDGRMLVVYKHDETERVLKECSAAILTGVRDADSRVKRLTEASFPVVAIGQVQDCFWVCPNDEQGGKLAAEHFLSKGCSKPLIIERILEGAGAKVRAQGFQAHMQQSGIVPGRLQISDKVAVELHVYRMISGMLRNQQFNFDAVFCETDEVAYGVLIALRDQNIDIPGQVKIIGFDDLPGFYEELTTLRQDVSHIAASAIELLSEAQKHMPVRNITLPVSLIIRSSTQI